MKALRLSIILNGWRRYAGFLSLWTRRRLTMPTIEERALALVSGLKLVEVG